MINDLFFDKQPPLDFIEELKGPIHVKRVSGYKIRNASSNEADISGAYLANRFDIDNGNLDTAYDDFLSFLKLYSLDGNSFPIKLIKKDTDCFESYTIEVLKNEINIYSNDTEGIRRALVELSERVVSSESNCISLGITQRSPFVKTRITRCVFSPINRYPKFIDELKDDVDYYPDNMLLRIARDGNNGIWIYTNFNSLLKSPIVQEFGEESERMLSKLRKVVDKCARYGIKVYVFGCEPHSLPEELCKKYNDMLGAVGFESKSLCPRSERAKEHIIGMVEGLFKAVPKLGGFISITAGEQDTTCQGSDRWMECPRCRQYSRGENLAYVTSLINEGIKRSGSDAEFISWTYGHRYWNFADIPEYVKFADPEVKLMQNFDDYGLQDQLGKTRLSIDYWLSYAGPSYLFDLTAKSAKEHGKPLYAKMQVCTSHEIASVPYVPVPGLVFEKYKGAHELGVSGILQCWYFGNYPSLMSRAAGMLSFEHDFADKRVFLIKLASSIFGGSNAEKIADSFELFEKGYKEFPINTMFSYYGPMQDGATWELQLIPKNRPLPRTWMLTDRPFGDRIYEAINAAHTLDEIIVLSRRMSQSFEEGVKLLPIDSCEELYSVSIALSLMIKSALNILSFYKLRELLGVYAYGSVDEDPLKILDKMKTIVYEEIDLSRKMIKISEKDPRLGYHSEAEGYKYFPEKIQFRIEQLKELLNSEFPIVEERISSGLAPLGYYICEGVSDAYLLTDEKRAEYKKIKDSSFALYRDEEKLTLDIKCSKGAEILFCFEFLLMKHESVLKINDGKLYMCDVQDAHLCGYYLDNYKNEIDRYELQSTDYGYKIRIDRCDYEISPIAPIKLKLQIDGESYVKEENPTTTLGKKDCSPDGFMWILPKN